MKTDTLMAICVGLGLRLHVVQKMFKKSKYKLDYYNEPDSSYIRILENIPIGLTINDFNELLKIRGQEPLGSKEK